MTEDKWKKQNLKNINKINVLEHNSFKDKHDISEHKKDIKHLKEIIKLKDEIIKSLELSVNIFKAKQIKCK